MWLRGVARWLRMAQDSRILSPIRYDVFERMAARDVAFGFRMVSYESGFDGEHFHAAVREHVRQERQRARQRGERAPPRPHWLLDACGPNATLRDFSVRRCGELYGVYNNWFVTRIAFWRSPPVRRLLEYIDASGTIYTRRYGDLLWQSVAVQMHLPLSRVHLFDDFTYEHATRAPRPRAAPDDAAPDDAALSNAAHDAAHDGATSPAPRGTMLADSSIVSVRTAISANRTDADGGAECIEFGGIAQGTDDPAGYVRIVAMAKQGAFCRPPCMRAVRVQGRLVVAATAGQVKVEQPSCDRQPPPYYCLAGGGVVAAAVERAAAAESLRDGLRGTAHPPPSYAPWGERWEMRERLMDLGDIDHAEHGGAGGEHAGAGIASHGSGAHGGTGKSAEGGKRGGGGGESHRNGGGAGGALHTLGSRRTRANASLWTVQRWSRAALAAAPLGTCVLPPAALHSGRCADAIRFIRSHPSRVNLRTGIRFSCAASIHRYLAACRHETGCVAPPPEHRWYLGNEEISCKERAMLPHSHAQTEQGAATAEGRAAALPARHQWVKHSCERVEALPLSATGHTTAARLAKGRARAASRPSAA